MNYKIISIALALGSTMVWAQSAEIGTWAGFRKGAVSFTFDDGAPSHVSDAAPLFDKYGYKGTFNLVVNWNPDWSGFGNMAKNGHEIASHSNSHGNNMSGEEESSKKNIQGKIQQKYGIITVAYPNCNVPNESAVLKNYIVGRICNGSWQGQSDDMGKDGPSNWAKVPAIMTGSQGTNDIQGPLKSAVNKGGWVAFLTHGFSGKNNGSATYSPTDLNTIEGALKYAQQNDKDVWVAPMGHVAMYIKERKAAKVEASSSGGTITVKLTHNIKDNVSDYDYPLSIRVKYDGSKAEVKQGDAKLESKIDGGYVYFDAVPNAGDIVISGEGGATPTSSSAAEPTSSAAAPSSSSQAPASSAATVPASSSSTDALPMQAFDSRGLAAYVDNNGYITVQNAQGLNITVFNSLGSVVRTTKGIGCLQKVYTGAKGMYVVKVGNKAWSVNIK
jgi:hypothetical protein